MYFPRTPLNSDIHKIIRENYRRVFFQKEIEGITLPFHLEREFKKYLTCGNPIHGMARFQCLHCQKDKFVAFSCKGRTLCPSCTGRTMASTAKHLCLEVFPNVPVRQWVLSMPYTHRFLLATNPNFLRKVLAIYHRTLNSFYTKSAKTKKIQGKPGAITVVQRFGGALNLNVHFHTLYADGVFYKKENGEVGFLEIIPSHDDVKKLTATLKKRINRALDRHEQVTSMDFSQETMYSSSVQNRDEEMKRPLALGKNGEAPYFENKLSRCHYEDGFSLHARVKILANQRDALEKLCRYILRGPVAKERIQLTDDGNVTLKLKTAYLDGTTHLQFTPEQFIKRIIALIPPPRQNTIRYVGVFGARHKMRSAVTNLERPIKKKDKKKNYYMPWAELFKHVFKVDVSFCEHCGGKLKLMASIVSPFACKKILENLKIEITEVNISPARGPPVMELFSQELENFDQQNYFEG